MNPRTRRPATGLGEFAFIDRFLKPLAGHPGALGLADDAAVLALPEGEAAVLAKDGMVEGVHFLPDCPPDTLAHKLLAVNASDLAAMGARPLGYLTFLARSPAVDAAWLESFAAGLGAAQARFGMTLLGGDTVATPGPLTLSCTVLGTLPFGAEIRRNGARPGDRLVVTGTLGDAALGLRILKGLAAEEEGALWLIDRYRRPTPRLGLGQALRGTATAMLDVSDGLLADLGHILDESRVGAVVGAAALPLSPVARHMPGARDCALAGGDDYELLFTVPPHKLDAALESARRLGVQATLIGKIVAGGGLTVLDERGVAFEPEGRGWRHF
ncbi:MAG: thiamine-phosphate kinase [Geminicoccaceae bacterium]|nr:thiamine-phosphate kinase [Geminicoccaceae bacterium]